MSRIRTRNGGRKAEPAGMPLGLRSMTKTRYIQSWKQERGCRRDENCADHGDTASTVTIEGMVDIHFAFRWNWRLQSARLRTT